MTLTGKYTIEEIEEVADALGALEKIIVPILEEHNYEDMGQQDAEKLRRHLWVASDALKCFALLIRIFKM